MNRRLIRSVLTVTCFLLPLSTPAQSPPTHKTDSALLRWKTTKSESTQKSCGNGIDFMDGGEGLDTVQYRGKRSEFKITRNSDKSYTVVDLVPCRAEVDIVINVERFVFADGTFTEEELFQGPRTDQKLFREEATALISRLKKNKEKKSVPIAVIPITPPGSEAKLWIGPARRAWVIRESIRLGSGFSTEPDWSKMPNLCINSCPQHYFVNEVAGKNEVHLIGIYEPAKPEIQPDGRVLAKEVKVHVRPTQKPVILMLTSNKPAIWEVEAAAGATLKEIWIGGSHQGNVVKSPKGTPVKTIPGHIYGINPTGREGDSGAGRYLAKAKTLTGQGVTSFQGDYTGVDFEVPFYGDKTIFAEIRQQHALALKNKTVRTINGSFPWVAGNEIRWIGKPPAGLRIKMPLRVPKNTPLTSVTYSVADGKFYGVNSHNLYVIDGASGVASKLTPPAGYPSMSWLAGVAYEPKSGRIFIASTWHAGYHHTFNPKTKEWRVFNIREGGGGFIGIGYDSISKRMLAIRGNQVMSLDSNFKPTQVTRFKNEFMQLGEPGASSQMTVVGDWILIQSAIPMQGPGGKFLIHKNNGDVRMYKGELR